MDFLKKALVIAVVTLCLFVPLRGARASVYGDCIYGSSQYQNCISASVSTSTPASTSSPASSNSGYGSSTMSGETPTSSPSAVTASPSSSSGVENLPETKETTEKTTNKILLFLGALAIAIAAIWLIVLFARRRRI